MSNSKKATLITVLVAALLAAAVVLGVLLGFNKAANVSDGATVTVTVNQLLYEQEDKVELIQKECEKAFGSATVTYEKKGVMSGDDSELVYGFKKGTKVEEIATALNTRFTTLTAEGGSLAGGFIKVTANENVVNQTFTAKNYLLRGVIAGVVFSLLAFVYVTIRSKWHNGLAVGLSVLFAMIATGALVVIARIPVTASTMYAVILSGLFAAITSVFAVNQTTEEKAAKGIFKTCGIAAATVLLLGAAGIIVGEWNLLWLAVTAILGIVSAGALGVCFAPAVSAALQPIVDRQEAAKDKFAYKGAKKSSNKEEQKD